MKSLSLNIDELYKIRQKELIDSLQNAMNTNTPVIVDVPTPCLVEPHQLTDIYLEYFDVLFLGEMIAPFCNTIDWEEMGEYGISHIRFTLCPRDPVGLGTELGRYAQTLKVLLDEGPEEGDWICEYPESDFESARETFGTALGAGDHDVYFSDLAANYVRNLIVAVSEWVDYELADEDLHHHKTYKELRGLYARWWDLCLESWADLDSETDNGEMEKRQKFPTCWTSNYIVLRNMNSPEQLEELAESEDMGVLCELAYHKNTPLKTLEKLATSEEGMLREQVAKNKNAPASLLKKLAGDKSRWVRQWVAYNENTPAEVLEELGAEVENTIREAVAGNPNSPPHLLETLAEDKHKHVRLFIAEHKYTPAAVLAKLAEDENDHVRRAAENNLKDRDSR